MPRKPPEFTLAELDKLPGERLDAESPRITEQAGAAADVLLASMAEPILRGHMHPGLWSEPA